MPASGLVRRPQSAAADAADVVVVGGGTVGAWCACFLRRGRRRAGRARRKRARSARARAAGRPASCAGRAAPPTAVRLGLWSRDVLPPASATELGIDSGFVEQGYFMPCFTEAEVQAARERMAMQQALGLDGALARRRTRPPSVNPTMAPRRAPGRHVRRRRRLASTRRATCRRTWSRWPSTGSGARARRRSPGSSGDGDGRRHRRAHVGGHDRDPSGSCSPAAPSSPRSARRPACGSRPAVRGTRSR